MTVLNGLQTVCNFFSGADLIAWCHGFQESDVPLRKKSTTILRPVSESRLLLIFHCFIALLSIGEISKRRFFLWKRIKFFPSTLRQRDLKRQRSPAILDLCLRKTTAEKLHGYRNVIVFEILRFQKRNVIVFEILRFQNVFHPHGNAEESWQKYLSWLKSDG